MGKIEYGEQVRYYYQRTFGRAIVNRHKDGMFLGFCKHTKRHWDKPGARQMVFVYFKGNKRASRVAMCQVKPAPHAPGE